MTDEQFVTFCQACWGEIPQPKQAIVRYHLIVSGKAKKPFMDWGWKKLIKTPTAEIYDFILADWKKARDLMLLGLASAPKK